ncbi:DNA-binding protein (plasmid) [Xanthomonas citri pv. citri]|uniref:DNA-binding protein n=1 Tax=Xanthomonas citri TaxID=346 RepID=UPI00193374E6|nr:DNA-binding protein [Xanthomonas citri]QRD62612.1 DNA-binding protein [Xanthomonas citri pv. citri]QRD67146.1 DNA-binding protein [Xanthomonas citri pv. citri]QRD71808.1 DNA-binding protein [Xanthomonas citri pv. citri]
MGRKTELTDAQVASAIIEVLRKGQRPSWEAVREITDNGSSIVLNRMIGDWFEIHGPALAKAPPAGEEVSIRQSLQSITEQAYAEFESRKAARVAELDGRAASLDGREQNLADREAALDERQQGQREYIEHLHAQCKEAEGLTTAAMLAKHQAQTELAIARDQLARAEEQLAEARTNAAGLHDELDRQTQDVGKAQGIAESVARELQDARSLVDRLRGELEAARGQGAVAQALHDASAVDVEKERSLARAAAEALQEQLKHLASTLNAALAQGATKDSTIADLQTQLASVREQLSSAELALRVAGDRAHDDAQAQARSERVEAQVQAAEQRILGAIDKAAKAARTEDAKARPRG